MCLSVQMLLLLFPCHTCRCSVSHSWDECRRWLPRCRPRCRSREMEKGKAPMREKSMVWGKNHSNADTLFPERLISCFSNLHTWDLTVFSVKPILILVVTFPFLLHCRCLSHCSSLTREGRTIAEKAIWLLTRTACHYFYSNPTRIWSHFF